MGCIYSNNGMGEDAGSCTLLSEDDNIIYCDYEGDEDPGYSCESYESDYYCSDCGRDLNIEECECDEG